MSFVCFAMRTATSTKPEPIHPEDLKALYAEAHVKMDLQDMPSAEQDMRAYLKARPGDATAHYGLGRILEMTQHSDAAKAEFERSIALAPNQAESYYQIGQMALDHGDYIGGPARVPEGSRARSEARRGSHCIGYRRFSTETVRRGRPIASSSHCRCARISARALLLWPRAGERPDRRKLPSGN